MRTCSKRMSAIRCIWVVLYIYNLLCFVMLFILETSTKYKALQKTYLWKESKGMLVVLVMEHLHAPNVLGCDADAP